MDEATQVGILEYNLSILMPEQRELNSFVEQEQAKAKLQSSTHTFTEMCWNKWVSQFYATIY